MKKAAMLLSLAFLVFAVVAYHAWEAARDAERERNESLEKASHEQSSIYWATARATAKIYTAFGSCHGVAVEFNGRAVILTAAHCIFQDGAARDGVYTFAHYVLEESGSVAYGFVDERESYAFFGPIFDENSVVIDPTVDLAFIRPDSESAIRGRALQVAKLPPDVGQFIFSTHWQNKCWALGDEDGCSEGKLLVPTLGLAIGYYFFSQSSDTQVTYTLPTFDGDSGSVIVNGARELVGITTQTSKNKVAGGIYTFSPDLPSIRLFLRKNLGGAEEFVGGDE